MTIVEEVRCSLDSVLKSKMLDVTRDYSKACKNIEGPFVFIGQAEYFSFVYSDALESGHFEYPIKSTNLSMLDLLPNFIRKNNIRTCVIFRPEWFLLYKEVFDELKQMGVSMIGYSTEPVPFSLEDLHQDKITRLNSLMDVLQLDYDILVHFDADSVDFLNSVGFNNIENYPLPVSKKVFYPEPDLEIKYDVCFLGRSTEYREKTLNPLKCEFNVVHVAHGLVNDDARKIMNSSRIVLNIHNYDYLNIEQRVAVALCCGKTVFSDRLSGSIFVEGIDYVCFENEWQLFEKVKNYIDNPWVIQPVVDLDIFSIESFIKFLKSDK
jgi:hypothetical protein